MGSESPIPGPQKNVKEMPFGLFLEALGPSFCILLGVQLYWDPFFAKPVRKQRFLV